MGFFSSIGKVFKKVAAPVAGVLGGVLGGPAGAVAGATMADAVWNSGSTTADSAYKDQMGFAREQFEYQKALHQNQLQWRVADAKKAGLHPMAALGLSSMQFSPVSGASYTPSGTDYSWIGDLGQNADYAATKGKTNAQQEAAFALSQKSAEIALEGQELDNEFKRLQIMEQVSRLTQTGPAAPEVNTNNPINEPESPFKEKPTGLVSDKDSSYHIWKMGDNLYDINLNPDYQATIGDEFGQVINAIKSAGRPDVWVNPHDGVAYAYDPDSGYFKRLSAMSAEEADRLLGRVGPDAPHFSPSEYAKRYYVGY